VGKETPLPSTHPHLRRLDPQFPRAYGARHPPPPFKNPGSATGRLKKFPTNMVRRKPTSTVSSNRPNSAVTAVSTEDVIDSSVRCWRQNCCLALKSFCRRRFRLRSSSPQAPSRYAYPSRTVCNNNVISRYIRAIILCRLEMGRCRVFRYRYDIYI